MDGRTRDLTPREERRAQLEHECSAPQHVVPRTRYRERHDPDDDGGAECEQERGRQRSGFGHVPSCTRVEREQNDARADVCEWKPERCTAKDAGDGGGKNGNREHSEQRQEAVGQVVGVEAVGVEGESHPDPPHGNEEPEELEEANGRRLGAERIRELADGGDEHQVEEQLEPRCAAIVVLVALKRPQARWLEQAGEGPHERALALSGP